MKRLSELEKKAKKARQKVHRLEEEIEKLKTADNFFPFLNSILAEWKAKLRTQACATPRKWKLVIYSHMDNSLHEWRRSVYVPPIFTEDTWLVEYWGEKGQDGKGVCVAFADNPESLLASELGVMQLALFHLPYIVCPAHFDHPKTLHDLYNSPDFGAYAYGLHKFFSETESVSNLRPVFGIAKPDLNNPEHVKQIYTHHFEKTQPVKRYSLRVQEMQTLLDAAKNDYNNYCKSVELKNRFFR